MDSFNLSALIIGFVITLTALYLYFKSEASSKSRINLSDVSFSRIYTIALPIVLAVIGAVLRFYALGQIPNGLHQDEASIGYEAYILSAFGVDRNGYRFPVYPITYGSGGGSPLMIYLNTLTTFLFGAGVVTLRALPAVLGAVTPVLFFLIIRTLSLESFSDAKNNLSLQEVSGDFLWLPLVALSIMVFCPWHLMLSRWSLDSNTVPFWVCLSLLLFITAARRQKLETSFKGIGTLFSSSDRHKSRTLAASDTGATCLFILAAICYSLTLYSYGSATFIIPIHLIILCVMCLKSGRMTVFQMTSGIVVFLLFSAPLILFYVVNAFGLPEIITPFFSINRFTANRSVFISGSGFLSAAAHNLFTMLKNMTFGSSDEQILNLIPGYPPLFTFTVPILAVGIAAGIVRAIRGEFIDRVFFSLLAPAFVFGIFIEEDITRMVLVFVPLIYFLTRGYIFIVSMFVTVQKSAASASIKYLAIVAKAICPALFFAGAFMFAQAYFVNYNSMCRDAFMPGYGDACAYADTIVEDVPLDILKNVHEGDDADVSKITGDSEATDASEESNIHVPTIISTYSHLSAPFMVALYYAKTPPEEFLQTVHYKDPDAEFRIADSFGQFRFGLPEELTAAIEAASASESSDSSSSSDAISIISSYLDAGDVIILHSSEAGKLDLSGFDVKNFEDFVVVSAKD